MLTYERASQVFVYDPSTGLLIWARRPEREFPDKRIANSWNSRWAGKAAGYTDAKGYLRASVDGESYLLHRVAWLMHYGAHPSDQVDHINGVKSDNRIFNLRCVHNTENSRNRSRRHDNKSGHIGVSWHKDTGKWVAQIGVNGRVRHLGLFTIKEDAIAARKAAEARHGFHPNHGRAA